MGVVIMISTYYQHPGFHLGRAFGFGGWWPSSCSTARVPESTKLKSKSETRYGLGFRFWGLGFRVPQPTKAAFFSERCNDVTITNLKAKVS